ncbi:MAG: hypothetical protein KIH63_004660 [Candidatus Saccharibacteria bacterium]|nr:hypothetical protein [Candidatus Saccharibacteria bacterium]
MSERGSFITEYMYCHDCRKKVGELLTDARESGWFLAQPLATMQDDTCSIWGGMMYDTYSGGEIHHWEAWRNKIEGAICHPLHVAVMSEDDDGKQIMIFKPREKIND